MVKSLKMIVCCDAEYGIGKNASLPWNIPSEMKLFKDKTIGNKNNCVIMGKNTFMSIPEKYRPLSQRHNVILTRDYSLQETYENDTHVSVLNNPDDILTFYQLTQYENYWIIGGKMLYEFILNHHVSLLDDIHISFIPHVYECDTYLYIEPYLEGFHIIEDTKYKLFHHKIFHKNIKN